MATTITNLQTLLLLLAVLVVVAILAQRLRIAPAILMVVAGVALAVVPGLPRFQIAPEFVMLFVLPPVIYAAGVSMSWREFKYNLRPIGLFAIGGVVFTTCVVAVATHYAIGVDWSIGFLLGAIVSPPDVIAPLAIASELGVPRRILVVLEGEGLVNDSIALVLYRFAVIAVLTGAFSLVHALWVFGVILVGEILYGIVVGWVMLRLRQWAHNTRVEIALALMTPCISFWMPAYLGGSGVLATATAGLYISWNGPTRITAATRLQGIFFWDLYVFLLDGFVFLYTGLQMRTVVERVHASGWSWMLFAMLLTTVVVIVARFIVIFPAVYVPRRISKSLAVRDPAPSWQTPFLVAFTGVRGVVSLAAALAIPLITVDGRSFPHRDLILFVTFGVIVTTLIGQGLFLPTLIRWLGLGHGAEEERQYEAERKRAARQQVLETAARRLDEIAAERKLPEDVLRLVHTNIDDQRQQVPTDLGDSLSLVQSSAELRTELIGEQRRHLHQLLRDGELSDESRRRIERELDLEEESLRNQPSVVL